MQESTPPEHEDMEGWWAGAACEGLDTYLFFPERGKSNRRAKQLCMECPVIDDCLEYAMKTRQKYGVWGGLGEEQRRKLHEEIAQRRRR